MNIWVALSDIILSSSRFHSLFPIWRLHFLLLIAYLVESNQYFIHEVT